jgi:type II secretory pathway pseudopilin PulG
MVDQVKVGTGSKPGHSWNRFAARVAVGLVSIALATGAWMAYQGISVSLQAENTLHATIFAIQLVQQFVDENKRWPKSWSELESISVSDPAPRYAWPTASNELQQRVFIDFAAHPLKVAEQDPWDFKAIKPIGPCYPGAEHSFVVSLQNTVRDSIEKSD